MTEKMPAPRPLLKKTIPIIIIIAIVLCGYYELFAGANFFVEEDPVIVYQYAHGNAIGNGWRPDKGLGISFFFGDPGLFHAWSVFTLWERLVRDPIFAYNSSLLILLMMAAAVQYFLIKRVAPGIGLAACLIAPLIVFGPLQHEFLFQRHWIALLIGTPLLIMLLYDYFTKPKAIHIMAGGLLLWFAWFFGSFAPFLQLLIVGFLFSVLFYIYFRTPIMKAALRTATFFITSVLLVVPLGFWIFYPLILESKLVGYVREAVYGNVPGIFDWKYLIVFFTDFFNSGWLSRHVVLTGADSISTISWTNCSVVFPLVFVYFLFRRSADFWEFMLKWLLIGLYLNELLMNCVPAYSNLFQMIINGYHLSKFQTSYHCLQVGLLGVFLANMARKSWRVDSRWLGRIEKAISIPLCIFYSTLAIFCVFSLVTPGLLTSIAERAIKALLPQMFHGYPRELILNAVLFNMQRLQESVRWYSLLFYLSSAMLVGVFIRKEWLERVWLRPKNIIAAILLINGILLSWTVYPLYKKELTWDQQRLQKIASQFKPTDRFYNFFELERQKTKNTLESFRKNWFEDDGTVRRNTVGFETPPGLSLSTSKSFCQRDVAEFTLNMFNADAGKNIAGLRDLNYGPMISSKLFDMCAVPYYFSYRQIPDTPDNLSLIYGSTQVSVYKNQSAWPYYYLAERAERLKDGTWPKNPVRGAAYLYEKDYLPISGGVGSSAISLKKFTYGKLIFDYDGDRENLLVIADAWHPFWRATSDGNPLPVVRANGVFKGIGLPRGQHQVVVYFDTTPYGRGICISIAAWIVFLASLAIVVRRKWEPSFLR